MTNLIQKHPSIVLAREITEICSPLTKLNISYFSHVRIDKYKKFSALGMNPEFAEHYLKNKYYAVDIHMVDEKKFGKFFVWDGIKFTGKAAEMCYEASLFGIYNPFTIIQRNDDGSLDYFHFANDSNQKQVNQAYFANMDLLQLFISYFKSQIKQSKTLTKAYQFTINTDIQKPVSFEDSSLIFNRDEFIQQVNMVKPEVNNVILSKRQNQILQLILSGKTIKEIAQVLSLSPRTVGHYFEMLKIKMNVSTRSELFTKTQSGSIVSNSSYF